MNRIFIWTVIGFISGFSDGYFWQNTPSFWMTLLGVSLYGVIENGRWCVVNNIPYELYEDSSHYEHTIKMFTMTVFPAWLFGSLLAFKIMNGVWYNF